VVSPYYSIFAPRTLRTSCSVFLHPSRAYSCKHASLCRVGATSMPPDPSPGGIRISPHSNISHFFSGQHLTPFTRTDLLRGTHSIRAAKRDTIPQAVLFIRHRTCRSVHGSWIFPSPCGSARHALRMSPGRLSAEVSLSEQLRSWPFPLQTVSYIEGFPARS